MKNKIHEATLFGVAFFDEIDEFSQQLILKQLECKRESLSSFDDVYVGIMNEFMNNSEKRSFIEQHKDEFLLFVKEVAVKYFVKESVHYYLYDCEIAKKLENLVQRKDMKSTLVKEFLYDCGLITTYVKKSPKKNTIFKTLISLELNTWIEKIILKKCGDLKEVIKKITDGIDNQCFIEWINEFSYLNMNKELEKIFIDDFQYDFKKSNQYETFATSFSTNLYGLDYADYIMGMELYPNKEFWFLGEIKHSMLQLLYYIYQYNGKTYVKKIIKYIFDSFNKRYPFKTIIQNQLPIFIYDQEYLDGLIRNAKMYTFDRFSKFLKLGSEKNYQILFYPIYTLSNINNILINGKKLFDDFIQYEYQEKTNEVIQIIYNLESIIQRETQQRKETMKDYFLSKIIDMNRYYYKDSDIIASFFPSFFDDENIINRIFIISYITHQIFKNEYYQGMVYIFEDLLGMLEESLQIIPQVKIHNSNREEKYLILKNILSKYNIILKNKDNYMIAILDRKSATYSEKEKFPILEQIGDALYEIAVEDILFYSFVPINEIDNEKKKYCSANSQCEIVKKMGLNNAYISVYNQMFEFIKLERTEIIQDDYDNSKEKYYADSFEMLLCAIYYDYGLDKTIRWIKTFIFETFPNLKENYFKPTYKEAIKLINEQYQLDSCEVLNSNLIHRLNIYFPGDIQLYINIDFISNQYTFLWRSLSKLLYILTIGNDTKNKRRAIAEHILDLKYPSPNEAKHNLYVQNSVLHEYLYHGIESAFQKYKEIFNQKLNVINLHFLDNCNFHCKHCFVKKSGKKLNIEELKKIVDNIQRYFIKRNIKNGRINLAGGEPLLYENLQELIDYISSKSIDVSIITNGFFLTKDFIIDNRHKISIIGISMDSINVKTNQSIGRCNQRNETLSDDRILELGKIIKEANIKLKINICVSKQNINEDLSEFLLKLKPNKIKLLQMVSNENNSYSNENTITDIEFRNYISKYNQFNNVVVETNNTMIDSYLIIDSEGNLSIDNFHKLDYPKYNMLEKELNDVIDKLPINQEHFNAHNSKN